MFSCSTESILARVGDVQEPILVLVLFVNAAHKSSGRRQNLIYEDEDGLLRRKLNPLANNIDKLANRQVRRNQIFFLIDGSDVTLFDLFADDRNAIGILLSNALSFSLALLERMLVLELAAHFDWIDGTSCEAK